MVVPQIRDAPVAVGVRIGDEMPGRALFIEGCLGAFRHWEHGDEVARIDARRLAGGAPSRHVVACEAPFSCKAMAKVQHVVLSNLLVTLYSCPNNAAACGKEMGGHGEAFRMQEWEGQGYTILVRQTCQ
ncbi:MAG: hypothetical protein NVS4B2_21550 [Chloroflexota bacterium]